MYFAPHKNIKIILKARFITHKTLTVPIHTAKVRAPPVHFTAHQKMSPLTF